MMCEHLNGAQKGRWRVRTAGAPITVKPLRRASGTYLGGACVKGRPGPNPGCIIAL